MSDAENQETTQTEVQNPNIAEFMGQFNELQSRVSQGVDKIDEFVDSRNREAVNKEVQNAAGRINEKVGGDAEMAELFLEKQYANNPDLKKLWDNRHDNPEELNKALDIVAEEWAAKNQNVVDPQIAENQRALQESQNSGGSVQADDVDTKLSNMGDGEFLSYMRKQRSS